MMDQLILKFPAQLKEAMLLGEAAEMKDHTDPINKVYVAGLGGSGIGANVVQESIKDSCTVPFYVGKAYDIPAYVDKHTLTICCSYSGNTEETLHSFKQMLHTGAKIVVISSGGKLIEEAKRLGIDFIVIPDNWPEARACLGYNIVAQLYVLNKLKIINEDFKAALKSSIDLIKFDLDDIQQSAQKVADNISDKTPVIYTTDRMEAVAVRLRQQLNENAKTLCWHHVIPEMNHNELTGWSEKKNDLAVIFFRNVDDFKRNQLRINISQQIISSYSETMIDIYSKGNSLMEKMIYLIHLGDWISWYLSKVKNVDAQAGASVKFLKSELAKS